MSQHIRGIRCTQKARQRACRRNKKGRRAPTHVVSIHAGLRCAESTRARRPKRSREESTRLGQRGTQQLVYRAGCRDLSPASRPGDGPDMQLFAGRCPKATQLIVESQRRSHRVQAAQQTPVARLPAAALKDSWQEGIGDCSEGSAVA
jgi:hypothetical protein